MRAYHRQDVSTPQASGSATDAADEIVLTLPALASYSRVARLAVSSIATRLEFTYDEIEDLRIAVGEMYGLLGDDPSARIRFRCLLGDEDLTIVATRLPAGPALVVTDLTRQILTGVADGAHIDPDAAAVTVVKRHQS